MVTVEVRIEERTRATGKLERCGHGSVTSAFSRPCSVITRTHSGIICAIEFAAESEAILFAQRLRWPYYLDQQVRGCWMTMQVPQIVMRSKPRSPTGTSLFAP
jgi:hypothetical protein